jgi:hypothetical protein
MDQNNDKIMCPAHRCKQGSLLLGARLENGTVAIFPEALAIDAEFIENAKNSPAPIEERFRFTNKCIEGGCKQWTGTACGVAERVVSFLDTVDEIDPHFPCSIRKNCRWFLQQQYDACKICPYILTEITETEVSDFFERQNAGH